MQRVSFLFFQNKHALPAFEYNRTYEVTFPYLKCPPRPPYPSATNTYKSIWPVLSAISHISSLFASTDTNRIYAIEKNIWL